LSIGQVLDRGRDVAHPVCLGEGFFLLLFVPLMAPIDQIDLRTLRLFTAAARCGSFSEAARRMGLLRRVASKAPPRGDYS